MNKTLQLQLVFVGISLLILVLVAFFPPSLRLTEVRFEQASADAERVSRAEERRRRQQEVGADHNEQVDSSENPESPTAEMPDESAPTGGEGPATVVRREQTEGASTTAVPVLQATRNSTRPRPAPPRRTPVPRVVDEFVDDAGEPENETDF